MSPRLWIACAALALAAPARAEELPPPRLSAESEARSLVQRLSSPRFREREVAARALLEIGAGAIPAVGEGCRGDDPAIAERCEQLRPALRLVAAGRLLERARDGGPVEGLPLVDAFFAACGDGVSARAFYLKDPRPGRGLPHADATARPTA